MMQPARKIFAGFHPVVQIPVVFVRSRAQLRETFVRKRRFCPNGTKVNGELLLNEFRFVTSWVLAWDQTAL